MNLWWARIRVDSRNPEARRDLRNVVGLHRRIMKLMPDNLGEQARQQVGVMFRVDETNAGITILVQSRCQPDLSRLPAGYGTAELRDGAPMLKALQTGTLVHYRIAANASKRQEAFVERGRPGPIVPLSGEAAEEWWTKRAETHGLRLVNSNIQGLNPARGTRANDEKSIRHSLTRFDGVATIVNADLVREAIENGIGRGKSHGCGLLSLAPVRAG
jgi:CRISPR system Cascade subunit CasE